MRVVVLGGGVIGVTTAWYLAGHGHQVTVIEREPAAGLQTSFANAGQISPGYSTPWAAPGIPLKALKWLFQQHAPLSIRPDGSLYQWAWLLAMLRECSADRYARNKERMLRLASYSRDCLAALREQTGIAYEGRQLGTLQIFRSQQQLDTIGKDVSILREAGVPHRLLTPAELGTYEPALEFVRHRLKGALQLPGDETGDCHLFTTRLAGLAAARGVEFCYGMRIEGFDALGDRVRAVICSPVGADRHDLTPRRIEADQFVLALGSYSRGLARGLDLKLPVYPLKGYSLTVAIADASRAPVSTVLDETYKIGITRFDQRIRVGGMAEVAGFDMALNPQRRATLAMVVDDLFYGAGDTPTASFWTGLRPMTPDSTPLVGATRYGNLWLNTGHGTLGWTMACGSGRLLADLISGRPPDISAAGLSLDRYGRA